MQLKNTSAVVTLTTSTSADIHVHASWVDLADAATTCAPDDDNTLFASATTANIVNSPAASTCRRIKLITLRNAHASNTNVVTVSHSDGTTTAQMPSVTLNPGDLLQYTEDRGWFYTAAATYRLTYLLGSDHSNSTTTPTSVSGLISDSLPVGTYNFTYQIRYQSSAATTGVKFDVNFTGTATSVVWNQTYVDTSATAATAVPDQDAVGAAAQVLGAFASRAFGTAGRGVTLSVDTANADMLTTIYGTFTVSVAGQLDLYHGSETANATSAMAGSNLVLQKVG